MTEPSANPTTSNFRLPLLLALTLAVGMFIGQQLPRSSRHFKSALEQPVANGSVLDQIMQFVRARYVDTVDVEGIKDRAIGTLLDQLDPHSVYITPEEATAVDEDMTGGFDGIGIEFIMLDDTIQVVTPMPGGPSERAGLLAGDRIVTINDSTVAGVKVENGKIYKMLRGHKGTEVRLGIVRGNEKTLRAITVLRDRIAVNSVESAYMLTDRTGYIKVNRFNANTHSEFMEALRKMVEEQHLTNLVIDLRGNPGGYLEEATQMLSQFFPEDKLLVYTEGRTDSRQEYKSTGRARFTIGQVAILIDEGSASASEIVAGAIQDHDRGWIIGRRSFGKGLVQEEYPLSNQGRLRLTIARYYTPSGRCIQREYKGNKKYNDEEANRLHSGELTDASKIKQADTTKYYTGIGRVVYSGGGITPDVFVPLDTSYFNPLFNEMNKYMPQFVSRWLEQHKGGLPTDEASFLANFNVTDETVKALAEYAVQHGAKFNDRQLAVARQEAKLRIKARLARILFGDDAQFKVINADDPAVEKALYLIGQGVPLVK
jgi:carboxyl-terminal processing protease